MYNSVSTVVLVITFFLNSTVYDEQLYVQVALLTGLMTVCCSLTLNADHKLCQVGLMFATHHTSGTPE